VKNAGKGNDSTWVRGRGKQGKVNMQLASAGKSGRWKARRHLVGSQIGIHCWKGIWGIKERLAFS